MNRESCGIKVIIKITIIPIKMKGGTPLTTSKKDLSKIAQAVNISTPKGGVADPIAQFKVTITPK